MRDAAGRSRGFGFVKYEFAEDGGSSGGSPLTPANVAIADMDSTKLGNKWVKVSHHRPHMPAVQLRREYWKSPSPARTPLAFPMDQAVEGRANPAENKETHEAPGTPEASGSGHRSSASQAESSKDQCEARSTSSSKVDEVAELFAGINLDELTFEALSSMAPTRVLHILTSGGDPLLRRLSVTKCERQYLPVFWGAEHPQRLDVIRYVNKVSPVSGQLIPAYRSPSTTGRSGATLPRASGRTLTA